MNFIMFNKKSFMLNISLLIWAVIIMTSISFAGEKKEFIYTELSRSNGGSNKISIEDEYVSYSSSFYVSITGHGCGKNDSLICISLPVWFTFAFPKDTSIWEIKGIQRNELTYNYGDYRFQIVSRVKLDWFNNDKAHLFYFIDAYFNDGVDGTKEKLVNSFVFSCEDGLQVITEVAQIEGGTVYGYPYLEEIGVVPSSLMRPIGDAFGAGQCNSELSLENKETK